MSKKPPKETKPILVSITQYAKLVDLCENTVREHVRNNVIKSELVGKKRMIRHPDAKFKEIAPVSTNIEDVKENLLTTVAGQIYTLSNMGQLEAREIKQLNELTKSYKILAEDDRARLKHNIFLTDEVEPFMLDYIEKSPKFRKKVEALLAGDKDGE